MSSYLVYIPGQPIRTEQALRDVGLGEIIDPQFPAACCDLSSGPDGSHGLLFYWQDSSNGGAGLSLLPSLRAEDNDWQPAKAYDGKPAGRFWLGKSKVKPVTPDGLLRRNYYGGLPVVLDDGNEWAIPVARQLPHSYGIDEFGRPARKIQSAYINFFDQSQAWLDKFRQYARDRTDPNVADGWYFAVEAIAMNYRVNQDIADWLQLMGDFTLPMAIAATFEMAHTLESLKKNGLMESLGITSG